jgi:hypothetical protein
MLDGSISRTHARTHARAHTHTHTRGLENREYGRRDPLRWPRGTFYPRKFALTSPTSGCRSVGIVRLGTQATEFPLFILLLYSSHTGWQIYLSGACCMHPAVHNCMLLISSHQHNELQLKDNYYEYMTMNTINSKQINTTIIIFVHYSVSTTFFNPAELS